ncbi:hypothetical protein [Sphingomonas mollis]|uniref:Uncharacterized protein n=1 Tax=Sphingomonas mollis TaxID=2795726 RepID=A0ABS0XVC1_9SPHN|nr:hypothetical protein [Sphingomonas sp. BT553]MBJ6123720.1 hypothetical protein [Sphingomonas sp. BT553]
MIANSTVGFCALPVGPLLSARPKERVSQPETQTPASPSSSPSSDASIAVQPGSLLSSSAVAELLKSTDAAPASRSAAVKPWTISHADMLDAIKRSKAYASGDDSGAGTLGKTYTSKDVAFIHATTGYNVIAMRGLTAVVDDNGFSASADGTDPANQIASAIEGARSHGALKGEITPDYAKSMISYYAGFMKDFPADWQDKALRFLGGTEKSQSELVTDRTTAAV